MLSVGVTNVEPRLLKSAIEVFLHAGIVALSKDVTDYGPRLCFPYYNVKIRHREGSPYPKLVTNLMFGSQLGTDMTFRYTSSEMAIAYK
jgi:hypothetical protein